jgi:type IV secretory pathway protease TraF
MVRYASYALWALIPLAMFFRINLSPSEPLGLYRVTREPLTYGAFVLLDSPLKRIAGMPGDTVRVTKEGSYINGKLWPLSAIPNDSTFTHYPYGTYTLRAGQFWILGNHADSYDSRFFGPIPRTLISSTVRSVWTNQ